MNGVKKTQVSHQHLDEKINYVKKRQVFDLPHVEMIIHWRSLLVLANWVWKEPPPGIYRGDEGGGDPIFLMTLHNTGIGQTSNNGFVLCFDWTKNNAFLWLEENLRLFQENAKLRLAPPNIGDSPLSKCLP